MTYNINKYLILFVLYIQVKYKREELLTHPVVACYVYDKWNSFGWWCSLSTLLIFVIFQVISFTTLVFLIPHPLGANCSYMKGI